MNRKTSTTITFAITTELVAINLISQNKPILLYGSGLPEPTLVEHEKTKY